MRRVCRLTVALALTALMVLWGGPARADISLASNSPLTLGNLVFTVSSCTISGTAVTCGDLKLAPHGTQGVIIEASSASQIFSVDCTSSCVSADLQVTLDVAALSAHTTLTSVSQGLVGSASPDNTGTERAVHASEVIAASYGPLKTNLTTPTATLALPDLPVPGTGCINTNSCLQLVKDIGISTSPFTNGAILTLTSVSQDFTTGVPEPTSASLLVVGLLALAARRKRIRS